MGLAKRAWNQQYAQPTLRVRWSHVGNQNAGSTEAQPGVVGYPAHSTDRDQIGPKRCTQDQQTWPSFLELSGEGEWAGMKVQGT